MLRRYVGVPQDLGLFERMVQSGAHALRKIEIDLPVDLRSPVQQSVETNLRRAE